MWVVTVKYNTGPRKKIVVVHRDGCNPNSICQALRLVREELVRQGVEDRARIETAEFDAGLELLQREGEAR